MRYRLQIAAERGISLNSPAPPEGFVTKGVSTYYDQDGNIKGQWVKDYIDSDKAKLAIDAAIAGLVEPLKGLAKPVKAPAKAYDDLLAFYPLADCHVGAYCWSEESGDDWDLDTAERAICRSIDYLVKATPPTKNALLGQLGDFLHIDSTSNATPASGHQLDVDSRFPQVVRVGVKILRYTIDKLLTNHQIVTVRNCAGNHDPHAYLVLVEALKALYEKEPRVIIADSPKAFWTYRFGKVMLACFHGHAPKPDKAAGLMSMDAPEDWAASKFKHAHHGHFHSRRVFEEWGVEVECHAAITGKDKWTAEMGYRANRKVSSIVYHKETGEQARHTIAIARIHSG